MKKLICILLMLILTLPALAEENVFAPFILAAPEEVTRTDNEGSVTFVYGMSRVVVIPVSRVPDDDPEEALTRMLSQFDPLAHKGEVLPVAEGYAGLTAEVADKFGEGVDLLIAMVLSPDGTLLIFSAHDMDGSREHAQALLDTMLSGMTVDGAPVVQKTK